MSGIRPTAGEETPGFRLFRRVGSGQFINQVASDLSPVLSVPYGIFGSCTDASSVTFFKFRVKGQGGQKIPGTTCRSIASVFDHVVKTGDPARIRFSQPSSRDEYIFFLKPQLSGAIP
jgi:hypothetical protein